MGRSGMGGGSSRGGGGGGGRGSMGRSSHSSRSGISHHSSFHSSSFNYHRPSFYYGPSRGHFSYHVHTGGGAGVSLVNAIFIFIFLAVFLSSIACSRLSVQLSQPDRIRCKTQILPNQVWYCGEGYWRFKQKSQYNKSWFTEVYQKIDASALHGLQSWQYGFRGRVLDSRLWEENGMVLGQIKGDKDILTIPSWAELITTPNTTKNSLPVPAGP